MKNSWVVFAGWLLIICCFSTYVFGIYKAVAISLSEGPIADGAYPEFLYTAVSTLHALLLTNLGIILGISIANPQSSVARNVLLSPPPLYSLQPTPPPMSLREKVQLAAVVIYMMALIACLATWIVKGFVTDEKAIVPLIPESGKMLGGVALAYVLAVLSTCFRTNSFIHRNQNQKTKSNVLS